MVAQRHRRRTISKRCFDARPAFRMRLGPLRPDALEPSLERIDLLLRCDGERGHPFGQRKGLGDHGGAALALGRE
eukprot:6962975-Pyramimonas_sp.AAC.1